MLQADTSAWAARLRYLQPQLLGRLRTLPALQEIGAIQSRIAPTEQKVPKAQQGAKPRLSKDAAQLLGSLADSNAGHPLSDALRRLARRGRPGN